MSSVKSIPLIGVLLMTAATSGCLHHQSMALGKEVKALDLTEKSVVLLTLQVENEYRPLFKPHAEMLVVEPSPESSIEPDLNKEHSRDMDTFRWRHQYGGGKGWQYFKVGSSHKNDKTDAREYLISMALAPGRYRLRYIIATAAVITHPTARAWSFIPVYAEFEVKPRSIRYLGSIEGVNRHRKADDQFRAGPIIPLLDQALPGFSDGTYCVRVTDHYEDDVSEFRQTCPGVQAAEISKMILQPMGSRVPVTQYADHE